VKVLVTGSEGFIGRHIVEALTRRPDSEAMGFDVGNTEADLERFLETADAVFHLAGVNRPREVTEFKTGNAGLTERICNTLRRLSRQPLFVLSSSTQAALDNPYGASKREAEEIVERYARETNASAVIFRLTNVFGKWCRPNYNSVVATFCHNIANGLPITINDSEREMELVYIDEVVSAFLGTLDEPPAPGSAEMRTAGPTFRIRLGELAEMIEGFRQSRVNLHVPDFSNGLVRRLYPTFLSYYPADGFGYDLDIKSDPRGSLAEFIKSETAGQIFVSRTKPGITRGNHYHHTKTEKFLVLEGSAVIRFRSIRGEDVIEYPVQGHEYRVLDIPPGYTHSITNVGNTELVVLFWSSEPFNPDNPDTWFEEVVRA
jgi:UDP-2-acetamido-2,6-beta-L-arabino-hexul-4-ose reductase